MGRQPVTPVSTECVLCDWQLDWMGEPWAVFLPGSPVPVGWTETLPATVRLADTIDGRSVAGVALVYHWSQAHPAQLRALIGGDYEVHPGLSRPQR